MDAWDRYEWTDRDRTLESGSVPTPGYDAVHAYASFADVDLADDVREQRPAGDVPTDQLKDALRRYVDAFADLAGVFEPDLPNNKNRLYKAPLSVRSSLDGVVTPIDRDAPTYQFTPLKETSGELVDETRAWADRFTADHRDAVEHDDAQPPPVNHPSHATTTTSRTFASRL